MAARPGWPLSTFVARLADAQNRLDEIQVGDLSVRASFHAGYDAIRDSDNPTDRAAARAFRFLGVLPGSSVGLQAAAALLDTDGGRLEDALERLVDAHLLHSLAPGRYQMHDLIRLFAREQVCTEEPATERERALERVLRFYLATAERAMTFLDVPPQATPPPAQESDTHRSLAMAPIRDRREAEAWLDAEGANLMAAVTHGATQSDSTARLALRLARPLHWYLYPHARARELRTLADVVITTARRLGDPECEAWGLDHLSAVHWLHRQYDEMYQCLDAALALWREIGVRDGERRTLANLADALGEQKLYEKSVVAQCRQLALARQAMDRMAQVTGLGSLARAYLGLDRIEEALSCLRESLMHAREIGERALESLALNEISFILFDQGRIQEAQEHMREATLLEQSHLGAYVRWRGYTWSAFFPACLTLPVGPKTAETGAEPTPPTRHR